MTARAPSARTVLSDAGEREVIRTVLDANVFVEAAAGTGKTSELVARIVAILAAGHAELNRIVAITFTEPAAGELKLRLRNAIEAARLDGSRPVAERARLNATLPKLEEARIGTIHAFCADLLRERPIEAAVDPLFEVADEGVAWSLFSRAFDRWFEAQLAQPGPAVQRILRRRTREPSFGRRDEGPRGILRSAAWQLVEHRDLSAPWRYSAHFDRDRRIDALLGEMESLSEWASRGNPRDYFCKSLFEIARAIEEMRRAERVRDRDYDWLEAWLMELVRKKHWGWKGFAHADDPDFPQEELRVRRDALHGHLKLFADDAGADLAPRLRDELWPVVEAYEAAKQQAGCLDFGDLLIRARDLVRDDPDARSWLQERFTHYFVDEFQDTDPLQVEIMMLLACNDPNVTDWRAATAKPGKLFLVGDPKQSIYRFRRADMNLYREVQERLAGQGARLVRLTVSFRSVPEIQEAVNAAFAPRFESDGYNYVPLATFRERCDRQPAVVALPVPAPYGDYRKVFKWRIDESLPDAIAAWIHWLVTESDWTVTERERPNVRVKVEPRHVCLLFRRLRSFGDDVTRRYVAALEARQIQHLMVGGGSFHDREEILTLRSALAAIERPDDELSVFATLRGPLLALSDASLIQWREVVGPLHPYRIPEQLPESLDEVAAALRLLRDLHKGRNRRSVADTIALLLEATRAHAAFAIWPTGMQALANIARLMSLAHQADQRGAISFRGFVERLESDAEQGDVAEAPLLEEGLQGVRLMSTHKAKGLEFPVVILADMTAREAHEQPQRWTDIARALCVQRLAGCVPPELREHTPEELEQERQEAGRILYVACTRARDVLVVPVVGDERQPGWLAALHPVVHPTPALARQPVAHQGPGTPLFGEDSVPFRPDEIARPRTSVMPGVHVPEVGRHHVTWWDPSKLQLGLLPPLGLAQMRLLQTDDEGRTQAGLAKWQMWDNARSQIVAAGKMPSRIVRTATHGTPAVDDIEGAEDIQVVDARWPGERPSGLRFGSLVHALLATVALDDDTKRVAEHAELHARLFGASDRERDAAIQVTAAALSHPLLRRAAAADRSGHCRRECAIVLQLEDGNMVEGIADLAFCEENTWAIVDFKTDGDLRGREEAYRRQVASYVLGVRLATSLSARGYLLLV